jgi:hypothetical protein
VLSADAQNLRTLKYSLQVESIDYSLVNDGLRLSFPPLLFTEDFDRVLLSLQSRTKEQNTGGTG